jgi:hypothetical protein
LTFVDSINTIIICKNFSISFVLQTLEIVTLLVLLSDKLEFIYWNYQQSLTFVDSFLTITCITPFVKLWVCSLVFWLNNYSLRVIGVIDFCWLLSTSHMHHNFCKTWVPFVLQVWSLLNLNALHFTLLKRIAVIDFCWLYYFTAKTESKQAITAKVVLQLLMEHLEREGYKSVVDAIQEESNVQCKFFISVVCPFYLYNFSKWIDFCWLELVKSSPILKKVTTY